MKRLRMILLLTPPILLMGYGALFNAQLILGQSRLPQGMLFLLTVPVLLLSLSDRPRWPRSIGLALLTAMSVFVGLILLQSLLGTITLQQLSTGLPAVLTTVLATALPLAAVLVSLAGYRHASPYRAVPLVLGIAALLILGIAQAVLRDPIVWTGTPGGTEWAPIVWKGTYLGYGDEYTVRAFSLFYSPVQYGVVAAATACAGAAWALTRRASRWWSVPLLALGLASTWASANRTVIVGLVLGLLMMIIARWRPRLRLIGLVVIPVAATVVLLLAKDAVTWAVNQGFLSRAYLATLLIRLNDFPEVLQRVVATPQQLLVGAVDFETLTQVARTQTHGEDALPIDNELLYLLGRFGVWGPLLMLTLWSALMTWAQREWWWWRHPAMLALIGLLGTWALGQNVNVLYMHALPVAAVLIALGVRSHAS